jgi:anti-anti-sigma factor
MSLTVTAEQKAKGAYIFYPSGALNSNTYPIFEEKINLILKESPTLLVFDLDELDYLSSAGIRVLLKARDALKKNNGKITFMNLQPQIKKVFDIINALPSMQIFKSIQELDEYLDVMQKKVTQGKGLVDS